MKALIDLHTHTISSGHAFSTLKENIEECKEKGLLYYGVSDHAITMPGTAHPCYFRNFKILNEEILGIKVLKGIEANIINIQGHIDVPEDVCKNLDYVIASLHPPCITPKSKEENTLAIMETMKNPYVKIIGHPDDDRFPLDLEPIVILAKKNNILLELNNSSFHPKSFRQNAHKNAKELLNLCKKYNTKIILGSDAHIFYEVGDFSNCLKLLEECNFPESLVVNFNEYEIKDFFINNKKNSKFYSKKQFT